MASVPANHVYVRHIAAEEPDGVVRLEDPDPDPDSPQRSAKERWWPPVMLDPSWIAQHDFDVFHVQFGFDAWDPDDLRRIVDAVHGRAGCATSARIARDPARPVTAVDAAYTCDTRVYLRAHTEMQRGPRLPGPSCSNAEFELYVHK